MRRRRALGRDGISASLAKDQKKRLSDLDRRARTFRADGNLTTKISHCVARFASCLSSVVDLVPFQGFRVDRLARVPLQEVIRKAENLKTAGITDDPKIQLVPFPVRGTSLHEARQTRLLFDSSIDGW